MSKDGQGLVKGKCGPEPTCPGSGGGEGKAGGEAGGEGGGEAGGEGEGEGRGEGEGNSVILPFRIHRRVLANPGDRSLQVESTLENIVNV